MKRSSIIFACAFVAQQAMAQSLVGSSPGFHYFDREGATIEEHDAAVIDCVLLTRGLVQPDPPSAATQGGLLGALIGGVIEGVINGNEERQGQAANVENCMAIKGWNVLGLSDEEGLAIEALEEPELMSGALAKIVGQPNDRRIWRGPYANELAHGPFAVGPATDLKEVSLSLRSVRGRVEEGSELSPPKAPDKYKKPKALKPIDDKYLGSADPSKSHLVFRLTGDPTLVTFDGLAFERINEDGSEGVFDGAAAHYSTLNRRSYSKKVDGVRTSDYVVEIPPGLWKIDGVVSGSAGMAIHADLCFGAPAFRIEPGQSVFVGKMTLNPGEGYPLDTSSMDDATAALSLAPQLLDTLVLAEFVNGYVSDCFGAYAYAYEIDGAPFVEAPAPEIEEMVSGAETTEAEIVAAAESEPAPVTEAADGVAGNGAGADAVAAQDFEMQPVGN